MPKALVHGLCNYLDDNAVNGCTLLLKKPVPALSPALVAATPVAVAPALAFCFYKLQQACFADARVP